MPDMYIEDDMSSRLLAPVDGNGGGSTLANTLTSENQGPPVVAYQTLTDGGGDTPAPAPVAVVPTAAPAGGAAPVVSISPNSVGALGKVWNKAVNAVSPGYNSLAASGQQAARSLGVKDETAAKIGAWAPWLLAAVLVGIGSTVYALRHRIFSHKITA